MKTSIRSFLCIFSLATILTGRTAFADLVLDQYFRPPNFVQPEAAPRMLLLPGGKILRFFNTDTLVDQSAKPLTRYLADGTLDTSFNFPDDYTNVIAAAALANGKVIVAASQSTYNIEAEKILRLNVDGSIDSTFTITEVVRNTGGSGSNIVVGIAFQLDGKIIVARQSIGEAPLVRLFADGGVDGSFPQLVLGRNNPQDNNLTFLSNKPVVQTDGKIIIYGVFRYIGNTNIPNGVARLNVDGTVDTSFQATGFTADLNNNIRAVAIQSDGKILLGGRSTVSSSFAANPTGQTYANLPIVRVGTNGSADQTYGCFNPPAGPQFRIRDIAIQSDGKAVATDNSGRASVFRFQTNGSLDSSFPQPKFTFRLNGLNPATPILIAVQGDGKILVSGSFTDIDDGSPLDDSNFGIVRFNANGTVDSSLITTHKPGFKDFPISFDRLPGGSTLVGFTGISFTGEAPVPYRIGRLLADGSVDSSFNPFSSTRFDKLGLTGFTRLASGKFLLYGFSDFGFGAFVYGRLNADGREDTSFTPDPNFFVFDAVYALTNGGALIGTKNAQGLLNANGSLRRVNEEIVLDPNFALDPTIVARQIIRDSQSFFQLIRLNLSSRVLAIQADGKIIFEYLYADDFHLVRLNANGTLDSNFSETVIAAFAPGVDFPFVVDPANGQQQQPQSGAYSATPAVTDAVALSDGRIVLAGRFTSFKSTPARGLVRLNSDGSVDPTFQIGGGAQWTSTTETSDFFPGVEQIEMQTDGHLLIAGTFEAFNGTPAPGIARLNADGSVDTSFVAPAVRQKFVTGTAILARQRDGSFLLSGPYSRPNETLAPSFIRIAGLPALLNISTRARVLTGDQVMIGGIIISGSEPKKVIFRAVGNSLSTNGQPMPGRLSDPTLSLYNASGAQIAFNDNWGDAAEPERTEITNSGLQPTDPQEPAILRTLMPGAYTAIVRGKGDSSGIALVEAYDLDPTADSHLANLSTRAFVDNGDNLVIGGAIAGSAGLDVVVRGLGPSLNTNGTPLSGRLADPTISVVNANGQVIAENDNYDPAQIPAALAPSDPLEAALRLTLPAGGTTTLLRGKNGGTGIGLVENYDVTPRP